MKKTNDSQIVKMRALTPITVEKLYFDLEDRLKLKLMTPGVRLDRKIRSAELHRPGLAFAGFYDYFAYHCVQILGQTEINYFHRLSERAIKKSLSTFFTYTIPCIIVSKNQRIPELLIKHAMKAGVPVFKSTLATSKLIAKITVYIEDQSTPSTTVHGTFLDVFGVGTLIVGKSGVGKSECALELIERRHRLVADDIVHVKLQAGAFLLGVSSEIIRHHMEIRGLGIINIQNIFGVGAIRNEKRISLVVTLERWNPKHEYERLGLEERRYTILGIDLPHLIIPVRPGRNIPILIEMVALTEREKRMGINSAREFNNRLLGVMAQNTGKETGV